MFQKEKPFGPSEWTGLPAKCCGHVFQIPWLMKNCPFSLAQSMPQT
jgi:hypothetical protein